MLNTDQCKMSKSKEYFHNIAQVSVSGQVSNMKHSAQSSDRGYAISNVSFCLCRHMISFHLDFWSEPGSDDTALGNLPLL